MAAGLVVASAALWASPAAPAPDEAPKTASLRIDCPSLNDEHRAALEARARADLAATPQDTGRIAIECRAQAAVVGWQSAGGDRREETLALDSSDQTRAVDGLLDAVHRVRTNPPPAPMGTAVPVAVAGAVPHRRDTAAAEPLPAPTVARVAVSSSPPAPLAVNARETAPAANGPRGLAAVAGIQGELWQGQIRGAIAGRLGARFITSSGWSAEIAGGYALGLATAQDVSARALQAMLGVGFAPHPRVGLLLGAELMQLRANLATATGDVVRTGMTEAAVVGARYLVPIGPIAVGIGPRVEVLARPVSVELGQAEIFRVPTFVAALSLEAQGMILP